MDSPYLGVVLDSSIIIAAERRGQGVVELLKDIRRSLGDVEVVISAVTVAELAHGVVRGKDPSDTKTTQSLR